MSSQVLLLQELGGAMQAPKVSVVIVDLQVPPQTVREAERLGAVLALKTFLTGVDESVLLQTGGLGECSWTLLAQERFLPAVSPHVDLEVGRLHEGGGAQLAPVRLLAFVHEGVAFEAGRLDERCRALCALVGLLPGVDSVVDLQLRGYAEGLIAHIALVRFLSSVCSAVPLQVAGEGERGGALVALIRLLASVAAHVNLQVDQLVKRGRAPLALEPFLPAVGVDVPLEVCGRREGRWALVALVRAKGVGSGVHDQLLGAGKHLGALSAPHAFGVVVAQRVASQLLALLVGLVAHATLEQQHLARIRLGLGLCLAFLPASGPGLFIRVRIVNVIQVVLSIQPCREVSGWLGAVQRRTLAARFHLLPLDLCDGPPSGVASLSPGSAWGCGEGLRAVIVWRLVLARWFFWEQGDMV